MVRVNLLHPERLADQHLIAEYDEILMLLGYVRRYPSIENLPKHYNLGKGHMRFFKDKLLYLKKRHELLKKEMRKRGFAANITINLQKFGRTHLQDWKPAERDYTIIRQRLAQKLRKKPAYYRYYGKHRELGFFLRLIRKD
jgi:deoxyribonuclease (pyrimidine dimer)